MLFWSTLRDNARRSNRPRVSISLLLLACVLASLCAAQTTAGPADGGSSSGGGGNSDDMDGEGPAISVSDGVMTLEASSDVTLAAGGNVMRLSDLVSSVTTLESTTTQLSETQATLIGDVQGLTAAANSLDARVQSVDGLAQSLATTINTHTGDLATATSARGSLERAINDLSTASQSAISDTSSEVDSLATLQITLSTQLVATSTLTDTLSTQVKQDVPALTTLLDQVSAMAKAALAKAEAPVDTDVDEVIACNKQGKVYDSDTEACIVPPPLTDKNLETCTDALVGTVRYNTDTKEMEYCSASKEFLAISLKPGYSDALPAKSCKHVLEATPGSTSGTYFLVSGSTVYQAYCDMTTDGGGWTLVLMISSSGTNTFYYGSSAWTSTAVINPTLTDPSVNQHMKNVGYSTLAFTQIRLAIGKMDVHHIHAITANSAREVFNGGERRVGTSRNTFFEYMTQNSVSASNFDNQPYCNVRGFNVFDGHGGRCRYGNIMNNENECQSSDSAIGFGCYTNGDTTGPRAVGSGGFRWDPTVVYAKRGWVFVR